MNALFGERPPGIRSVTALVLAMLAAGCASNGTNSGPGPTLGASSRLSDWGACGWTYPDNSSVDCTRNLAVPAEAASPNGWVCVDRVADSSRSVKLLTSLGGDYGVEYDVAGKSKIYGRIELHDGQKRLSQPFGGGGHGFVRFSEKLGNKGDWSAQIYDFAASGRPHFLSTESLSMHLTEYAGQLWFVWAFRDGDANYYFQRMDSVTLDGETRWIPNGFALAGSDFELKTEAEKRILSFSEYDLLVAAQRCG